MRMEIVAVVFDGTENLDGEIGDRSDVVRSKGVGERGEFTVQRRN
jgi:hypothetical protein